MTVETMVDPAALREQVKDKYREVAAEPDKEFHFHTGRPLTRRLGYDQTVVDQFPDAAVESFAGVGNPFPWLNFRPAKRWSTPDRGPASIHSSPPARLAPRAPSSAST